MLALSRALALCPDCPPAREARRLVVEGELWPAAAIVAPFVIAAGLVALVVKLVNRST